MKFAGLNLQVSAELFYFFVLGQVPARADDKFNNILVTKQDDPISIVYDPPGDSSYAYYREMSTTVNYNFGEFSAELGIKGLATNALLMAQT